MVFKWFVSRLVGVQSMLRILDGAQDEARLCIYIQMRNSINIYQNSSNIYNDLRDILK